MNQPLPDYAHFVLLAMAQDPSTSSERLREIYEIVTPSWSTRTMEGVNTAEIERGIRLALVKNPSLPPDLFLAMVGRHPVAASENPAILLYALEHPGFIEQALAKLISTTGNEDWLTNSKVYPALLHALVGAPCAKFDLMPLRKMAVQVGVYDPYYRYAQAFLLQCPLKIEVFAHQVVRVYCVERSRTHQSVNTAEIFENRALELLNRIFQGNRWVDQVLGLPKLAQISDLQELIELED